MSTIPFWIQGWPSQEIPAFHDDPKVVEAWVARLKNHFNDSPIFELKSQTLDDGGPYYLPELLLKAGEILHQEVQEIPGGKWILTLAEITLNEDSHRFALMEFWDFTANTGMGPGFLVSGDEDEVTFWRDGFEFKVENSTVP